MGDPLKDALFLRTWLKHEPLTAFPDFEGFVRFLREQQGGLDWNNYDPFLDEHVGVEGCHMQIPAVASELLAMHNDGVPMLTRRELVTDNPGFYATVQEERFSVFFDLPASTYAFQLRVNSDTTELKSHGLPEFLRLGLLSGRRVFELSRAGGAVHG